MEFELYFKDTENTKGEKIKVLDEKKTLKEWKEKLRNFKPNKGSAPPAPIVGINNEQVKSLIDNNNQYIKNLINENKKQSESFVNENKKQSESLIEINNEQVKGLIDESERKERMIKELTVNVDKLSSDNKKLSNNQVKLLKRLEKLEREQKSEISSVPEF